ncbi:MAG: 1-phosphofructokinase family hexose kinase [Actinomycetota bacterium]
MQQARIVTVTSNPALDRATSAPHVTAGPKLRCLAPRVDPGGGGINAARVVRLLGGYATVVTTLGGATGQRLGELLTAAGLAARVVPISGETRESLTVDDTSTSEQYRFVMPGPTLAPDEVEQLIDTAVDQVLPGTIVVASGSLSVGAPHDTWAELARRATARGGRVILDTSGPAAQAALGSGIEVLRCNDREMAALIGRPLDDPETQERELRRLVDEGAAKVFVMGLGAEGSLVVSADEILRVPAPSLPMRSAVGAGDSLVGAFTLGLARGWTLGDAATFGVVAAAAAHTTPGTELCRREDVERLFEEATGRPIPTD